MRHPLAAPDQRHIAEREARRPLQLAERDVLDEAESLLEAALEVKPNYVAARLDYVRVLIDRQKYLRAREETDTLLRLEPGNRAYLSLYAAACVGLGEYEPAIALYRELLAASPASADLHVSLGHSLRAVGRKKEATEDLCLCRCCFLSPYLSIVSTMDRSKVPNSAAKALKASSYGWLVRSLLKSRMRWTRHFC